MKAILLVLLMLAGTGAWAQELRGLQRFHFVVEDLDDDATQCGVTQALIENAARSVLDNSRLNVVRGYPESQGYLYFQVTVLRPAGGCVASVGIRLGTAIKGTSLYGTGIYAAGVYNDLYLTSGEPGTFGTRVTRAIEGLVKGFVARWNKDNS